MIQGERLSTESKGELRRDFNALGFRCMTVDDAALALIPASYKHTNPSVDYLCGRVCSVQWCHDNLQAGRCIRDLSYWRTRLDGIIAAVACGCHTLECESCRTGGRPKPACRYCAHLSQWESDHIDDIRKWRGQLG